MKTRWRRRGGCRGGGRGGGAEADQDGEADGRRLYGMVEWRSACLTGGGWTREDGVVPLPGREGGGAVAPRRRRGNSAWTEAERRRRGEWC